MFDRVNGLDVNANGEAIIAVITVRPILGDRHLNFDVVALTSDARLSRRIARCEASALAQTIVAYMIDHCGCVPLVRHPADPKACQVAHIHEDNWIAWSQGDISLTEATRPAVNATRADRAANWEAYKAAIR